MLSEAEILAGLNVAAGEGEETAEIYRREARAKYETDREAASSLLLDAAYANDRDDNPVEVIVRDLNLAVSICPENAWIYSSAQRLMIKLGLWREAIELIERELQLTKATDERVALCMTASDLNWVVANQPDKALEYSKMALSLDPACVGALYTGLWLGDADVREKSALSLAKILGAPPERSVLYALAGSIESARGNEAQALESYTQAALADKTGPYTQLRCAVLNERFGKYVEASSCYAQVAQIVEDPALSGEFYRRAAVILGYAGQKERACYYLAQAQKRVENRFEATWFASDSNRNSGNPGRVIELEKQLIDMSPDDATRAIHWLAVADICMNETRDIDQAVQALESASVLGRSDIADPQLVGIYQANGEWGACAAVLRRMLVNAEAQGPCLRWLLGNALWNNGDVEEAIEAFSALKGGLGNFRLELALESIENHEAMARHLEAWMRATTDVAMHDALLSRLVTILTERLNAPDIAIQYLKKDVQTRASRDLLCKKLYLAMALSQFETAVESLKKLAEETTDADEALVWSMEAAYILANDAHQIDGAVALLRQIHEKSPNYMPAVIFLHSIGMKERRSELVIQANAWLESFHQPVSKRAMTARENARLYQLSGDTANAVLWYDRARRLEPLDGYHLRNYIELLKSNERWNDAILVIEDYLLAHENDASDALNLSDELDDLGELDDLSDLADEIELSLSAKKVDVEIDVFRSMLFDLKSFCEKRTSDICSGRKRQFDASPTLSSGFNYLIESAVSEDPDQVQAVTGSIRVMVPGLSEEVRALLNWCEAEIIRKRHPESVDSRTAVSIINLLRKSLEQKYGTCLRAEILRCLRESEQENVTSWLERYAQLTPDRWMSMTLSREAALRSIWLDEDYDLARRVLLNSRDDADRRTLWMFEHFSAVSEDWKALGFFREKLAGLEVSTRARLQTLKSAMSPYIDDGLMEHAVRVAQECLKLDGHAFPALITLAHVAEDNEDLQSLAAIADRLSEASEFSANRIEYGLWAAQLWSESLSLPEQALASLERLLAQEPDCLAAISMCELLYEKLGRFDSLGRIYSRAISAITDEQSQIEILRKHAQLLATHLEDAPAASLALERIVKLNPSDLDALNMLAELLIVQSRWNEAVDIYEQITKLAETPEQKRLVNLKLSGILVHQLEQPERAKNILKRHLVLFERDMPALQLLYDIARNERNWVEARNTLEEICRADGTREARNARLAFTRVAREAGWNHDTRTLYERQAIAAVIGYREEFDALIEDYKTHNELPRLIDVAKRELSQQGSSELIAQYRGCVAALYVANNQHREALSFLSDVIQDSQNTDWAYLARAQALTSAGQLDSAIGEFRRTLIRNIKLEDAYEPFADALRQTGDEVSLAAISAIQALNRDGRLEEPWTRCVKGVPRGYFDVEQIGIARTFIDAQRYLRTMSPYVFEMFPDSLQMTPIEASHWVFGRCHRMFGQNFEIKKAYSSRGLKSELCRVSLQETPALIFDESLLDENNQIAFDFWASYAMHQAVTGGCIMDALSDSSVDALFSALCQAKPEAALAQTMKKQLFRVLPRPERKLFKDGVPFLAPGWSDFRTALQSRAACVAAVISASPGYALHARPGDETLKTFLISDSFARFIKTYWTLK